MRPARARISDWSIRSAGITAELTPQGSGRISPRYPHSPPHTVPGHGCPPGRRAGHEESRMEMRREESGRAEPCHIQLRIHLKETVPTTEGSDRRILARELA